MVVLRKSEVFFRADTKITSLSKNYERPPIKYPGKWQRHSDIAGKTLFFREKVFRFLGF